MSDETICDTCEDYSNSEPGLPCGRIDDEAPPGTLPCPGTYREDNVLASRMLDEHHEMIPDEDDNGDFDDCLVCMFHAGWLDVPGAKRGHATHCDTDVIREWIDIYERRRKLPAVTITYGELESYAGRPLSDG